MIKFLGNGSTKNGSGGWRVGSISIITVTVTLIATERERVGDEVDLRCLSATAST